MQKPLTRDDGRTRKTSSKQSPGDIEALESRTMFSGSADVLSPLVSRVSLPAKVVGGSTVHASGAVHVLNTGSAAPTGLTTVELLVSPDGLASDASVLGSRSINLPLKAGKSTTVTVPIVSIPNSAYGNLFVFARTIDSGGTMIDSPNSAKTIDVVAPFIGLKETSTTVHPNVFGTKPQDFTGTLTVLNTGNEIASGMLTVVADGYNASHPLGTINANQYQFTANIKPGQREKFVVHDQYLGAGSVPTGIFNLHLLITLDGVTEQITVPGTYTVK